VSDFATAAAIFQRLGLVEKQLYEKQRETFQLGGVEAVIDELPYGNFVELEGAETEIHTIALQLGLDWERRIVTNYLQLMSELKQFHQLNFDDITFANFETCDAAVADLPAYAFADGR
jgi:adenylate cyclase class 2